MDSFGHNAMLPQILKKSGMENYVFMRPMPHEKDINEDLFWWESPDGSRVCAYRIPLAYNIDPPRIGQIGQIKEIAGKKSAEIIWLSTALEITAAALPLR